MLSMKSLEESSRKNENLSLIFSLTPKDAATLLNGINLKGVWLLRESSKPGCLTVTYLKSATNKVTHIRFGFSEGHWQVIGDRTFDEKKDSIDPKAITSESAVLQLIDTLKKIGPGCNGEVGFDIQNAIYFIKPASKAECAKNSHYELYDSSYIIKDSENKPEIKLSSHYSSFFSEEEKGKEEEDDTWLKGLGHGQ
ncbi:SH2 domain-containing protein [Legionella spiritensis]|uniref:SH2 domain-containing protein n=1 Tax=Legionella spiritensis TaxID=452 RepID=UPI000F72090E|nr:SH2 domain-containing protein [Legionella spiritensis]VEG90876.1 Uncharacterised protein [Legionella spiritensis]